MVKITVDSRQLMPLSKTLGVGKAINFIANTVKKFNINTKFPIFSLYTTGISNCEKLEQKLKDFNIIVNERKQVGPTIGTHVGPNVYGICFVEQ